MALDKPEFSVPQLRAGSDRVVEVRPRRVQEWLDGLPLSDPAAAASRLYQALYALNRVPLQADNRYELLEVYRDTSIALSEALRPSFTTLPLPLVGRVRRLAEMRRGLELELATGYKRVLMDSLDGSRQPARQRYVAPVLGMILEQTGRLLRSHYEVYLPCPPGAWRELHKAYALAEKLDLTGLRAGDDDLTASYLRVLLLGLCNPYGMLQGDCERVWRFLMNRAGHARILTDPAGIEPEGHFLISLNADTAPIPFPRVAVEANSRLRVLDALPLVENLRTFAADLEAGRTPAGLDRLTDFVDSGYQDLLGRMSRFWGMVVKRQASRAASDEPVSVCIGLNVAHYFLSGERVVGEPVTGVAETAATYVDLDEFVARPAASTDQIATPESDLPATDTWRNAGSYQVFRWHTKDEGAGGMALRYRDEDPVRVRVGDVVLVQGESGSDWQVSTVRWMRCAAAGDALEIGIQRLAPQVRPVLVRPLPVDTTDGQQQESRRALLLPGSELLGQPASLLVPRGTHAPDQSFVMVDPDAGTAIVRIRSVMDRTGTYERLVFEQDHEVSDAERGAAAAR